MPRHTLFTRPVSPVSAVLMACAVLWISPVAAQDLSAPLEETTVDLILSPSFDDAAAPFYRGASIKVGERIVPIIEGTVTGASLAQYNPSSDVVVISAATDGTEIAKGEALMDVMSALQINDIATAAGR